MGEAQSLIAVGVSAVDDEGGVGIKEGGDIRKIRLETVYGQGHGAGDVAGLIFGEGAGIEEKVLAGAVEGGGFLKSQEGKSGSLEGGVEGFPGFMAGRKGMGGEVLGKGSGKKGHSQKGAKTERNS